MGEVPGEGEVGVVPVVPPVGVEGVAAGGVVTAGVVPLSVVVVPEAVVVPSPPPPQAATSADAAMSETNLFFWNMVFILKEYLTREVQSARMILPAARECGFVAAQSRLGDTSG